MSSENPRSSKTVAQRRPTKKRYFQYRVTEVGGEMEGRISVGDLTLDWWQGTGHTYIIFDLEKGEETGWYRVKSEGECDADQYARLAEQGR